MQGINVNNYYNFNRIQEQQYSNVAKNVIREDNDAAAKNAQESQVQSSAMDLRLDSIRPRENASLEDISLSLNASSDSFEMKGRDSEIASLDMDKAVSDMQKDQALMQYQFFVGNNAMSFSDEDGMVTAKIQGM